MIVRVAIVAGVASFAADPTDVFPASVSIEVGRFREPIKGLFGATTSDKF